MLQRILLLIALTGNFLFCFCLPWIIEIEIPTKFRKENISNIDRLLEKLQEKTPFSLYLYSHLSVETQEILKQEKNSAILVQNILKDLNKILEQEDFYEWESIPELQKFQSLLKNLNKILEEEDFYESEKFKEWEPEIQKFIQEVVERKDRKLFYGFIIQKVYDDCLLPLKSYWIHPPAFHHFLWFGTYNQENLLYTVSNSAGITLTIGFFSLLFSIALGIFFIFLEFHPDTTSWIRPIEKRLMYFPRLFLLILFCVFFKLQETSQLSWDIRYYLVFALGITGSFFLCSQTYEEICEMKEKLFVSFAYSLGYSSFMVFLKHVLHNCSSLPVSIVKQMRDNILFLSILTFIGVVHLQPEDLGGLIVKLYNDPKAFFQGWWILFFPCAFLTWLIFFFDLLGEELKRKMEKRKISIIK